MKKILALMFIVVSSLAAKSAKKEVSIDEGRVILVEGAITGSTARNMVNEIDRMEKDTSRPIDLVFNSPGGELLSGYLVVDRMEAARAKGVKVRCFVRGLAASMAFQMLLHCDERYATPHALLLWHPVRIFWMGPLTQADASLIAKHLKSANRTVLDDLKKHLPDLSIKDLLWHYQQESLHQAVSLDRIAPRFFDYIGNDIGNMHSAGTSDSRAGRQDNNLDIRSIIYIHERFLQGVRQ